MSFVNKGDISPYTLPEQLYNNLIKFVENLFFLFAIYVQDVSATDRVLKLFHFCLFFSLRRVWKTNDSLVFRKQKLG